MFIPFCHAKSGTQHRLRTAFSIFLCLILAFPAEAAAPPAGAAAKCVALTFDDGPTGRLTRRLLASLAEQSAHATFFLCGDRIEQMPDVTAEIAAGGHEIGVHCYTHAYLNRCSEAEIRRSIDRTSSLIAEVTGCEPMLFRPPGGLCSEALDAACRAELMPVILWRVDPRDWASRSASEISRRVLSEVRDGDIILMHDLRDSSVDAAIAIVRTLRAAGYRFLTVSELAQARGVTLAPGAVYRSLPKGGSTAASSRAYTSG